MDTVERIEKEMLYRKEVARDYQMDSALKKVINRNRKNWFRRHLWNLLFWFVWHNRGSVLSDMLFAAYRMGINDTRYDGPDEDIPQN